MRVHINNAYHASSSSANAGLEETPDVHKPLARHLLSGRNILVHTRLLLVRSWRSDCASPFATSREPLHQAIPELLRDWRWLVMSWDEVAQNLQSHQLAVASEEVAQN